MDVTFQLLRPRAYVLNHSVVADTSARPRLSMSLWRVGGAAVFDEVPAKTDYLVTGTRSGTIDPGRYRFVFHHSVGGDVGSFGPYSVGLSLNR